jgi:hypothetical protein
VNPRSLLYNFKGSAGDGSFPNSAPVALNGLLFGTTFYGGSSKTRSGTVYQVSLSGAERVVPRFDVSEGGRPSQPVVDKGAFYGTTWRGGSPRCGCAVVFEPSP